MWEEDMLGPSEGSGMSDLEMNNIKIHFMHG